MRTFSKCVPVILIALLAGTGSMEARDIITQAPEGKSATYYADFLNFDNTFGFMGDYHSQQQIIFSDDGTKAYFPNLLLRRTMPAYIEGRVDNEQRTITIESGQWVFFFPNVEIPVALYPLDAEGKAGKTSDSFYTEPLVLDIADDGTLSLRNSEELPMFGLCNAENSEEVYANAKELRFIPADLVDGELSYADYSYSVDGDRRETTASFYYENDDTLWIRGFVPKYPDAWIKAGRDDAGWTASSFQLLYFFATEDPIVFAATDGSKLYQRLPLDIDASTGIIRAADGDLEMCTVTPDDSGGHEIYLRFTDLLLTPKTVEIAVPATPEFIAYEKLSTETLFRFSASPTDTEGELLPKDCLSFRLFTDGNPYTFTPTEYPWIKSEMASVPYTFDDYNFFSQGGATNEERYVYFQQLPDDTEMLAVELIYTLNGKEAASARLNYDIASGESFTTGISFPIAGHDAPEICTDLLGNRISDPRPGQIVIIRRDGKSRKVVIR